MGDYNVAFRSTKATGGYKGVVTWTSFESEDDFKAWYTDDIKTQQEIVEAGVSQERCIELSRSTPAISRVTASIQDATDDEGNVHPEILFRKLQMALIADNMK